MLSATVRSQDGRQQPIRYALNDVNVVRSSLGGVMRCNVWVGEEMVSEYAAAVSYTHLDVYKRQLSDDEPGGCHHRTLWGKAYL